MSRVRRLLVTNRIFFVTINLRRSLAALEDGEFPLIVAALEKSRKKLNFKLCSYVLMPDHWHALIGVQPPLTISRAVQDVKVATARLLCRGLLDFGIMRWEVRSKLMRGYNPHFRLSVPGSCVPGSQSSQAAGVV